jgi:hypothetical protein
MIGTILAPCAESDLPGVFLARAESAAGRGESIAAGVLMREALRQQLYALCAAHRCLPKRRWTHNSPSVLANRCRQAGLIDAGQHAQIRAMIHVGNAAAHCNPFDSGELGALLALARAFIEAVALT